MKIINADEKDFVEQNEELKINGASLVFYSVRVLREPLTGEQIDKLKELTAFKRIQLTQGYVEKIFHLNTTTCQEHLIFQSDRKTELSPIETDTNELIHPIVNYYITLYSKSILLIQLVIVFDKRNISKFPFCTDIQSPIDTNFILKFIHKMKDQKDDWYKNLSVDVNRIVASFLEHVFEVYHAGIFLNISNKDEQSLSLQIWDIASYLYEKNVEIKGEELANRYELELSAILSCYNEHFSTDGLWKQQSANQVHRSALSKTDVLMDHQVLLNERVCTEISQIDHPVLRPISATRLAAYGYDSTSIFLWGYITIMNLGYMVCDLKSCELQKEMKEMIRSTKNHIWTTNDILKFTIDKQEISKELELYNSLKNKCIEERHKYFINTGINIKGLNEIHDRIKQVFVEINELSRIFIETETSSKSNEIGELLKEVKELNQRNGVASTSLTLISVFVAILALIPLKDALKSFITIPNFELFWVGGVLGVALFFVIYRLFCNK